MSALLLSQLIEAMEPSPQPDDPGGPAVAQALSDAVEEARVRWPQLSLSDVAFCAFVASRVAPDEGWSDAVCELHLVDLFLVAGCGAQDASALAILEQDYLQDIELRLHDLPNYTDLAAEIRQRVWEKLVTAPAGIKPKIEQYAGAGALRSWLQTVVTREALGVLRQQKREAPLGDDVFWRMACPQDDQEERFLKHVYRDAFKAAFQDALAALSSRDRTILKCHYIDGLSSEQIGLIYRAHRATVARWLQRIRGELMSATFGQMQRELGLSHDGAHSLFHLIQSQLDVSLFRVLEK